MTGLPSEAQLRTSYDALRTMLRAQGPVRSELDHPSVWRLTKDSSEDETATLLHHGIYSSTHLLGLKQQAELAYWLWKYYPSSENIKLADRTLREFVFIVEGIMPDRGWTAEIEKKRGKEVHLAARSAGALADGTEAGPRCGDSNSTMDVLEEEFGSMDVQQEIDRMKKENDVKDEQEKEAKDRKLRTRSKGKQKKKK